MSVVIEMLLASVLDTTTPAPPMRLTLSILPPPSLNLRAAPPAADSEDILTTKVFASSEGNVTDNVFVPPAKLIF